MKCQDGYREPSYEQKKSIIQTKGFISRWYYRYCIANAVCNLQLPGHPGLDIDVGEFLDNIQLNNLKDIFEKEQVRRVLQLTISYKYL